MNPLRNINWAQVGLFGVLVVIIALAVDFLHTSVDFPLGIWRVDSDDMWTALAAFGGIIYLFIRQKRSEAKQSEDHTELRREQMMIDNTNGSIAELKQRVIRNEEEKGLLETQMHERIEALKAEIDELRELGGNGD